MEPWPTDGEQKLLLSWKQKCNSCYEKYHLGNEQIYRKWMSAKFWIEILSFRKFEETPHTQKYEKTCLRKKQNGREPNDRSCRGKPSIAKENQRGINAEKSQATKRVRKYNNKIRRTDGGERDPHRAFIEYVGHRPNRPKVITFLKTSTWVQLTAQNPMPGTRRFQL